MRYWEPDDDHPSLEGLKDWVSDNVVAAQKDLIDSGKGRVSVKNGRLTFSFVSHEMPHIDGERDDLWHKDFDVIKMLEDDPFFYVPYAELHKAQQEEMEAFAKAIDDFADAFRKVAGMPAR